MKRTLLFNSVSHCTRSKKPKLTKELDTKNTWVAATHIYNYMIKDPVVDWLKLSSNSRPRSFSDNKNSCSFTNVLMNYGIKFEKELIKHINDTLIPITTVSEYINSESCKKTIDLMMAGTPIIHSAPVKNKYNNTGGIIDLLVRSDYLENLVEVCPITNTEQQISAPKLNGNYHYVVIDIKYSTLPLRSDQRHLLNSGNYPAYKAQLCIYNQAISHIQGYLPRYSFVLGRRCKYTTKGISTTTYNCLTKLGVIDFEDVDKDYISKTKKAIKWVRDVNANGREWTINPPSRQELYPNMCIDSGIWNKEKKRIADELGEITTIWNCGIKHRDVAFLNEITSWKNSNCTSSNIGVNGKNAHIIDKIMAINRQNKDKILPKKLVEDISKIGDEMFVDFETLTDIFPNFNNLPEQSPMGMIFMIGVGWIEDDKWIYKSFICTEPTYEEEYRIMNEFSELVRERNNPRLHYWHAEKSFWSSAECRQFNIVEDEEIKDNISNNWKNYQWNDLCSLFKSEPIVLKGCFKFGLKDIAKTMRSHNMISSHNDSQCDSGMTATVRAWECYQTNKDVLESDEIKDIEKYNEFDCKVLWDILSYLRNNHT